jgi:G patch domain-containing protein 1
MAYYSKKVLPGEVRDEQGRRRLHGAFTGGWSAGFYNTVGSAEGWAPSTFVSSRDRQAQEQATVQRPEDFMDEEDGLLGMR